MASQPEADRRDETANRQGVTAAGRPVVSIIPFAKKSQPCSGHQPPDASPAFSHDPVFKS